jgi:hypothetical protein
LAIVGKDLPFTIFDDEKIKPYLDSIEGDSRAPNAGQDDAPGGGDGGDDLAGGRTGGANVNVGMESMEH